MSQIGAIFYVAWGLLHLNAAYLVYKLGSRQAAGMVQGRLYQNAWNLAFFAVSVAVVGIAYNWFGSPLGFWLNLILASAGDLGFIFFVVLPGYLPLWPGLLGPALWLLGVTFSALGQWVVRP
jgi:hypothetical protein